MRANRERKGWFLPAGRSTARSCRRSVSRGRTREREREERELRANSDKEWEAEHYVCPLVPLLTEGEQREREKKES